MLVETGRVVAVEEDSLWVETIRQSTCGSCAAQKGCGHGLLNRYADGKRGYIQHLAVGEELRGLGVASELVGRCLSALKSQGIEKSHVHVLKDNALGRRYWSGRGWTERSEVVMYSFINGENDNA